MTYTEHGNAIRLHRGEIEGGVRWVTITNLQNDSEKMLNGKIGIVLNEKRNHDGRHQVQVEGIQQVKLIKSENLSTITDKHLVQVCRIPCDGERENQRVLLFPKKHSMFQDGHKNPHGNAPAMALCGLPLVVKKTNARKRFECRADYDNMLATRLMIEPNSGFAPPQWDSNVGPVLVYRPNGKNLSADDMDVINEFLDALLDEYGDGPEFNPKTWINPNHFRSFVQQIKENRELKNLTLLDPHALDLKTAADLVPWFWRHVF